MSRRMTRIFHQTLAATGSLAAAARAANLPLAEARRLRRQSPPTEPEGEARRVAQAVAALEAEAVRRALEGVAEPVFHQGRECGSKVKHSDTLLMFLLKTLRPERYGPGACRPDPASDEAAHSDETASPFGPGTFGAGLARTAFMLEIDLSAAGQDGPVPGQGREGAPGLVAGVAAPEPAG